VSFAIVVRPGFEPRQAEPKSAVLPLHHRTLPANGGAKVNIFLQSTKKQPFDVFKWSVIPSVLILYIRSQIFFTLIVQPNNPLKVIKP
jgi:hypothetical protein